MLDGLVTIVSTNAIVRTRPVTLMVTVWVPRLVREDGSVTNVSIVSKIDKLINSVIMNCFLFTNLYQPTLSVCMSVHVISTTPNLGTK